MKAKFRRDLKKNNKGLTLVELIIAMAVSVIIMGGVIMLISSSLRSYNRASYAVDLQMESQVLMEQMSKWEMEGNYAFVSSGDVLVIYDVPRVIEIDDSKMPLGYTKDSEDLHMKIFWLGTNGKRLYMTEKTYSTWSKTDSYFGEAFVQSLNLMSLEQAENCIAPHATSFDPSVAVNSNAKDPGYVVTIKMELQEGDQKYSVKEDVQLRNEILYN